MWTVASSRAQTAIDDGTWAGGMDAGRFISVIMDKTSLDTRAVTALVQQALKNATSDDRLRYVNEDAARHFLEQLRNLSNDNLAKCGRSAPQLGSRQVRT
jgi:hypothetical protein